MTQQQYVDEVYAERTFKRLTEMSVALDHDPLIHGPKRLNNKVAECRNLLNEVERVFLDVSHRLHTSGRAYRLLETSFDVQRKHMLATDPLVRAERSVSDRDAATSMRLKAEVAEMADLAMQVSDLESILRVVKAKRADLKDTQGRLRDQINLCREEIGLRQQWGSQPPPGTKNPIKGDGPTISDVDDMLRGVDEEIDIAGLAKDADDAGLEAPEVEEAPAPEATPEVEPEAPEAPEAPEPEKVVEPAKPEVAAEPPPEPEAPEAPAPVEPSEEDRDVLFTFDGGSTPATLPKGNGTDAQVDDMVEQVDVTKAGGRSTLEELDDLAIDQLLAGFD